MHSPTRKVTVKEQQDWKIPPCISNWKNAKGYTIPLDKRLAALERLSPARVSGTHKMVNYRGMEMAVVKVRRRQNCWLLDVCKM